tara:strand:- start:5908 stop:6675 length:768 start_codon:yes stop_codon:yes gene_type:complete
VIKIKYKIFPKISTRGFYDLQNGKTLKKANYEIYPPKVIDKILNGTEFVIMIHGLRNNQSGALAKYIIAQKRLKALCYKHPVIGFSYDSNTTGVQYKSTAVSALNTGIIIAKKNGHNLSRFILYAKEKNPVIKIRLMGHSLGAQVILSTIQNLAKNYKNKNIIESIHIFAGSIPANSFSSRKFGNAFQMIVNKKIISYYSPYDDVLRTAHREKWIDQPIGYEGKVGKSVSKYSQKRVKQKNHRFLSYSKNLKSFP